MSCGVPNVPAKSTKKTLAVMIESSGEWMNSSGISCMSV